MRELFWGEKCVEVARSKRKTKTKKVFLGENETKWILGSIVKLSVLKRFQSATFSVEYLNLCGHNLSSNPKSFKVSRKNLQKIFRMP